MKYKLIASDFDGTLANSRDFISPENEAAIADYIAAGGVFTVSSGRMYASVMRKIKALNLDKYGIPVMSFQGALVTDSVTGEHIYKRLMNRELVAEIAEYCEEKGYYFHTYSADEIFIAEKNELSEAYCKAVHVEQYARYVGKVSEFLRNNDVELVKGLVINFDPIKLEEIRRELNAHFDGRVSFMNSSTMLVECVDNSAGKGNALLHVAEKLGIDRSETVAIGDAMNDLSMIRAAGMGCAVANAAEKLKEEADFLAVSNDDNAVAQIIRLALKDKLIANNKKENK